LLTDYLKSTAASNNTIQLIVIGQKGAQFIARLQNTSLIGAYPNWPANPHLSDLKPITNTILNNYLDGRIDSTKVVYTHFISTIKQSAVIESILPIDPHPTEPTQLEIRNELRFEPTPQAVLNSLLPRFIEMQVYQANLEAIASEHSMRMMAMKNASDNASDIIDELTLTYNSVRQSAITQELAEITAGAEALQ
jgi:F-type H+-transporting ATPase subunit gamma